MARFAAAMLVGLVFLDGCASMDQAASEEVVTVAMRHPGLICAGVCPNDDVTVWPDGRVLVVQYSATPPVGITRFRVSRAQATRFREILAPHRPAVEQLRDPVCDNEGDEAITMKVTEIEVTWTQGAESDQLTACIRESPVLLDAIHNAMRSIGLYITGHRPKDLGLPDRG